MAIIVKINVLFPKFMKECSEVTSGCKFTHNQCLHGDIFIAAELFMQIFLTGVPRTTTP